MKNNAVLDQIFGGDPLPFRTVYEAAQMVVRDYMEANNCKIGKVAELLGTTEGQLYAVLDPKQTHKPLSVDRVIELTTLTGDNRIIDAMGHAIKTPDEERCSAHKIFMATLSVQSHTGELSTVLSKAMEDGELDENERDTIRKKAMDEMGALQEIVNLTR